MIPSRSPRDAADTPPPLKGRVKVWDPVVRLFHWTVAGGVVANLTFLEHSRTPHRYVGYVVVGAVAVRILWGIVAKGHARLASFVPGPRAFATYARSLVARRDARYLGHNPAGAAMAILLVLLIIVLGATGYMMGTDRFWGVGWVEQVHETAANAVLVASLVHVAGALIESVRHRENLVLAMITGTKRAATGTDIDHAPTSRRG
ncbi:cytochrome B [Sphingomonas sanguinis]|jgi:cytochrome b|uniref:Cytochrome B n=1 Tax=Sphingomonas sanguinis TaxID=33051 RepID=A0A7Y7USY2_9SPHN|nr:MULTISPECIES: cytochrome b/b6 domain-containing protein [Sphingomonas]MBI0533495.1 cytochrome b [Sphingomonas sp. TX0522]NNG51921.1 cytochrome B [Sphingomonas sanguinis]NVP32835.1 cytochrome b/b6 domain-containing protein [Sphingomonas sanguinis]OAN65060.1 cytochrome B [Sphingomonas sp. TDK1]